MTHHTCSPTNRRTFTLRTRTAWRAFALATTLTALPNGRASAQTATPTRPLGGEAPTTGVRLHAPTLIGRVDATALEVNPAAIGLLQSWSAVYHHSETPADGRILGRGDGFFLALPLPFYRALAVGAALQWLRPPGPVGYADSVKLGFSLAWHPVRWLGFGLAFHTFISDDDPEIDDLEAVDTGLVLRFNPWIGLGLAVRNLNTPLYGDLPLQRVYDMELTVRPLSGSDRLEVGAGLAVGERRGDVDPHLRIVGEPLPGLSLLGHVELMQRDFYRDGDDRLDVRATLGLQLSLEQLSVTASTLVGRSFDRGPGALGQYDAARSAFQGINVSVAASGARTRSLLPSKHVLQLTLDGRLDERKWTTVVGLLRSVEYRDDIIGVIFQLDDLVLGWGTAQELRRSIDRLRRRGKTVYAYLQAPGARTYYAVANANKLLLSPGGGIRLQGLAVQQLYLRGLFDKVGVQPQFLRIAEYKSAPEAFTRSGPSAPAKAMMNALVDDIYGQIVDDLATSRGRPAAKMRAQIDEGPFTPEDARRAGLVDELVGEEQLTSKLTKDLGAQPIGPAAAQRRSERWPVGPAIAVVLIDGDIVHGESRHVPLLDRRMAGDKTLAQVLAQVRADSRIRAVVLRIDSPGGSALASERIWRAVRKTAERKPVIASMANVAASGGYYAAAGAHQIIANPATVTGSIGIFTGKFGLAGLLQKLGIGVDTTERGKRATLESPFRPYTAEERSFILARLQYYYRSFLSAVAQSRQMTADAVHAVARGRVWTGRQAKEQHLVDRYGGLSDAIDEAKRRAGLPPERPVELVVLPRPQSGLLKRLVSLVDRVDPLEQAIPTAVRSKLRQLPTLMWYAEPTDPLARMPFELVE